MADFQLNSGSWLSLSLNSGCESKIVADFQLNFGLWLCLGLNSGCESTIVADFQFVACVGTLMHVDDVMLQTIKNGIVMIMILMVTLLVNVQLIACKGTLIACRG